MRVDLDAKIRTRDGEEAGSVQRAIIDPESNEITDFVVSTGGFLGRDVLVPREQVERASRDGNVIVLGLTKEELDQMPDYVPAYYSLPPGAWLPPAGYYLPPTGYLWPISCPYRREQASLVMDQEGRSEPQGAKHSPAVSKGAMVLDRDGEDIGVVDDVRFDPQSGNLTGLVVRLGGILRTLLGGGETATVAGHQIGRVDEGGTIRLRAGKDDLRRIED